MAFFVTMFCCNLLIPLAMVIGGYLMVKKPPQKINRIVGYRTPFSKGVSLKTWIYPSYWTEQLV